MVCLRHGCTNTVCYTGSCDPLYYLYEMATSTVEGFERVINRHLRRWIGVPSSFNIIGLYGRTNQLKLQMTSIVEELKERKTGYNPETVNRWPDKEGGHRDMQRKKMVSKPRSLPGRKQATTQRHRRNYRCREPRSWQHKTTTLDHFQ